MLSVYIPFPSHKTRSSRLPPVSPLYAYLLCYRRPFRMYLYITTA